MKSRSSKFQLVSTKKPARPAKDQVTWMVCLISTLAWSSTSRRVQYPTTIWSSQAGTINLNKHRQHPRAFRSLADSKLRHFTIRGLWKRWRTSSRWCTRKMKRCMEEGICQGEDKSSKTAWWRDNKTSSIEEVHQCHPSKTALMQLGLSLLSNQLWAVYRSLNRISSHLESMSVDLTRPRETKRLTSSLRLSVLTAPKSTIWHYNTKAVRSRVDRLVEKCTNQHFRELK